MTFALVDHSSNQITQRNSVSKALTSCDAITANISVIIVTASKTNLLCVCCAPGMSSESRRQVLMAWASAADLPVFQMTVQAASAHEQVVMMMPC